MLNITKTNFTFSVHHATILSERFTTDKYVNAI